MPTSRRAPKGEAAAAAAAARADAPRDEVNKVVADAPVPADADADDSAARERPDGSVKLPTIVQFPLAITISFATASMGYSILGALTQGELATVTRNLEMGQEIALLAAWRIFELALSWFTKLDGVDVAMMNLLSHGPAIYLLVAFYNLAPTTALAALAIDMVSASAPFYILRPLSAVHKASSPLPNRGLIDLSLQLLTTGLSTSIYTVTLVLSLRFILPRIFVLYFNGLPSVEPAYTASYATVLPITLLFGAAASTFIFPPFATTGKAKEDDLITEFNPVEASLGQTVWWNFCGYTAKAKVVILRTAMTVLVTGIDTYLSCAVTVPGVEATGAAAYAAVWVFAALCTGIGLGCVGRD